MADKLKQLKQQQASPFVFQVMNGETGAAIHCYVLPLNPENFQVVHTPRANLTYTQGGHFEDLAGNAHPKFVLTGTFGFQGNVSLAPPAQGFNVQQLGSVSGVFNSVVTGLFGTPTKPGPGKTMRMGVELTAWDMYQELEGMFLEFYELFGTYGKDGKRIEESSGPGGPGEYNHAAKKYYKLGLNTQPSMGTPPKLVFGNMADESYWYVQVNKFEIRRSTQRRMLYQYEIQLTGLSPYVSTKAAGFMDSWWAKYPLSSPPNRSMLTQALKAYAFVSQSVSTLRNLISDIDRSVEMIRTSVKALGSSFESIGGEVANLNNLFTVQGTGRIATPYNVVIETRAKVDEALPIALAITGLPHEYVDALRQTKRELFLYEQNEHLFIKSTSTGGVTPAATSSATTLPEILTGVPPQKSVKDSYIQDTVPEQTVFGTDPLAGMGSIITEETVRQGETIETIARNFGVPWEHLAAVNELDYPYVADVCPPGKNVLVPGDRLKITSANAQKPMFETGTDWTVTLYGIDEFLDANGDCQIGSTGDAKTISGIPNLEMQLRHRLNSLRGDLKHLGHPVYGSNIPTFVGKPDTEVWLKLAFKEAENTFLDDPRIASIRSLELVQQGDKCSIQAALIPVNQTNVALLNIPLLF